MDGWAKANTNRSNLISIWEAKFGGIKWIIYSINFTLFCYFLIY